MSMPNFKFKRTGADPDDKEYFVFADGVNIGTVCVEWRRLGGWQWVWKHDGYPGVPTRKEAAQRLYKEWKK